MHDHFAKMHPIVNFTYFISVILLAMLHTNPIMLFISFVCSMVYCTYLGGTKSLKFNFLGIFPMIILLAIINPLFNHRGMTILTYLPNGNPITLESILYGVFGAFTVMTVIVWFSCYNMVISSDKFIYIFGKIVPSLSLLISMALRFVPRFKSQFKKVIDAQKMLGMQKEKSVIGRARNAVKILSIMITWAFEDAIDTSDSMKARGYGLPGRTSFSNYRFTSKDAAILFALLLLLIATIIGMISGKTYAVFYPKITINEIDTKAILIYVCYFVLNIIPMVINVLEDIKWQQLQSKI